MSDSMSEFRDRVEVHRSLFAKRGSALSTECIPPVGQAADWYWQAVQVVPRSGQHVARQLARLCGEDSQATMPWRSLAEAVAKRDRAGRTRAYAESGVDVLTRAGWLEVETVGKGRKARTTFRLMPGDPAEWHDLPGPDEREDLLGMAA